MRYLNEDYDPNCAHDHENRAGELIDDGQVTDGEAAIVVALLAVSARLNNLADALLTRQDPS